MLIKISAAFSKGGKNTRKETETLQVEQGINKGVVI